MLTFAVNQALLSAYFQADFFGKCIFFGLFSLSILCWVVLIQKTLQARGTKKLSEAFIRTFDEKKGGLLSLSLEALPQPSKKGAHNPFARIFQTMKQKTLEILNKNKFFSEEKDEIFLTRSDLELVESHVLITISSEAKRLEKNLFILAMIVSLAPFLGLLGTVWGILITFSELSTGGSASSNTAIIGGLSTALATTVLGLVIAIPALIFYSYLKNTLRHLTSDMEDFLYKLLSTIELQYRKPEHSYQCVEKE
ncbi:MAG: Biopolymer transport protein ExbB [Chlamydiae bacterium]|nr:Biopolymer transport protein ExbB [Chlamydiota bacterium]